MKNQTNRQPAAPDKPADQGADANAEQANGTSAEQDTNANVEEASDTSATSEDPAEQAPEKAGAIAYEVAPGRTVGGKGPGKMVELDDNDALRLYELGFILDEDGNRVGMTEGPKTVTGVEIKEV